MLLAPGHRPFEELIGKAERPSGPAVPLERELAHHRERDLRRRASAQIEPHARFTGILRVRTGRLGPGIIAHAAFNAVAVIALSRA